MPTGSTPPFDPTDHLLPEGRHRSAVGPTAGIIIILVLLVIAAFYFWGAHIQNAKINSQNDLPLIPADNSTAIPLNS